MFHRLSLAIALVLPSLAMAASELEQETSAWHEARVKRLTAEDGWLALVGLHWLEEGANPAGSKEGSAVRLPAGAPALLGTFTREGMKARFAPAEGVEVRLGDERFSGGAVRTDAEGKPELLRAGSLQLLVIARGDRLGVRVRDANAPARLGFKGLERFPVSDAWRKEARFEPAKEGATISVPNVLGQISEVPLAGTASFRHEKKEYRLLATREGDSLFFVFGDLTNRKETYGAGRFLYTPLPKEGVVVLDFNRAYNPPCAFSAFATCPLPVKENKLKLRIPAGEKRYGAH